MVVSFFPKDCCHVLPAVHGGMSLQTTLCFGCEDPPANKTLMSVSLTLGFLPSGGWTATRLAGCGVRPQTYSLIPFLKIFFISGVDFFVCSIFFSVSLEVTPSPEEHPSTLPSVSGADEVSQLCLTYSTLILETYFCWVYT